MIVEWILWSIIWTKVRDAVCMLAREPVPIPFISVLLHICGHSKKHLDGFQLLKLIVIKQLLLFGEGDNTARG